MFFAVISLGFYFTQKASSADVSGVIISEIAWMGTAASANDEWIELFNNTAEVIDLKDWTLTSAGGQLNIKLSGQIAPSGYFLLERTDETTINDIQADQIYTGSLANEGEKLELKDAGGVLMDSVDCAAGWFAGDNITKASMERIDPLKTGVKENWANNSGIVINGKDGKNNNLLATPRAQNSVYLNPPLPATPPTGESNPAPAAPVGGSTPASPVPAAELEENKNYDYAQNIFISEVFPNPIGSDLENEFIELYNNEDRAVNLSGWEIGDESSKKYKITEANGVAPIAPARGFFVIYRKESKIALNNDTDSVKLYQPLGDNPFQTVKYEKAKEGWSYNTNFQLAINNYQFGYVWSEIITPGKENIIKSVNHKPVVDFGAPEKIIIGMPVIFDSSDTVDEDGDGLKYEWDFGDGLKNNLANPEHAFFKAGEYKVKLSVSDGKETVKKEKAIKVDGSAAASSLVNIGNELAAPASNSSIIINELLPNPAGSDSQGEFIELYNKGGSEINLLDWKIDYGGNKKPFQFLDDVWLGQDGFYSLSRAKSKIVLNNSAALIKLVDDSGELVDSVQYEDAAEGEAYARGANGKWFWTKKLTPGEENIILLADKETALKNGSKKPTRIKKVLGEKIFSVALDKVKDLEPGDFVKVGGLVAVKPGSLGSQYFYIVGEENIKAGLQIYNYKKEFPELKIGDYIEANGELSEIAGELRLKTKSKDDIKVLGQKEPPMPTVVSCDKIDDESVGQLVKMAGEITSKKGSTVYLDDGTNEAIVYLKKGTGITSRDIKEGATAEITGIISKAESGLRILPRFMEDIAIKDADASGLPGTVSSQNEWALEGRNKKSELIKYLLVIAGGIIIVLAVALTRTIKRGKKL